MLDITAKEMKGHNILAVERFQDKTRHMIEFDIRVQNSPYGAWCDEVRLFLDETDFAAALASHKRQEIKIKKYAHIIEGHIIFPKKKHRRKDCV